MEVAFVEVTRNEYRLLLDAFDVLGGIIDQLEDQGWDDDEDE